MRGVGIDDELGDGCGLDDVGSVVRDSGDETFLLTVSSLRMLSHSCCC